MAENIQLTIRKSSCMDDWYLIERKYHDGKEWFNKIPGGSELCCSSRIGNADIEGTGEEMLSIAKAIDEMKNIGFRRCAVEFTKDGVLFASPRNTIDTGPSVTLDNAKALSLEIKSLIGSARNE
jgi:hypothetical protein